MEKIYSNTPKQLVATSVKNIRDYAKEQIEKSLIRLERKKLYTKIKITIDTSLNEEEDVSIRINSVISAYEPDDFIPTE